MGFEYGYSVERPDALVLWEAQFGDFVNGAQTIVDEFISSSEQKWGQRSSVVLLLPHGFEGQGPDHSSARIERFLTLCAQDNMTVAYPSTPASYFHLLRRQAYAAPAPPAHRLHARSRCCGSRPRRACPRTSRRSGSARSCPDRPEPPTARSGRVLIAAGKVVHDLEAEREKRGDRETAILRVEQYYPLPAADLARELAHYPGAEVVVVQDEPENMGAWPFLALNLPAGPGRPRRAPSAADRLASPVRVPGERVAPPAPVRAGRPHRPVLRPLSAGRPAVCRGIPQDHRARPCGAAPRVR